MIDKPVKEAGWAFLSKFMPEMRAAAARGDAPPPEWVLRLLREQFSEIERLRIANVDLAIATAKKWAEAVRILRVVAQRAQSTDGNEEDVTAIYRGVNEALAALSPEPRE